MTLKQIAPWVIYKYTNKINGKVYIGQTIHIERRYAEHIWMSNWKNPTYISILARAIKRYGIENFTVEVIAGCYSAERASELEIFYINYFDSLNSGYNIRGSEQGLHKFNDAERRVLSCKLQGRSTTPNPTGYVGVEPRKMGFMTSIKVNGVRRAKTFKTLLESAEAYDKMALFVYGTQARINFPEKREHYIQLDLQEFYNFFTTPLVKKTSKYKGVTKIGNKWGCYYCVARKRISVKQGFLTEEDAYEYLQNHLASLATL